MDLPGITPTLLISQIKNTIPFVWGNSDAFKDISFIETVFKTESLIVTNPLLGSLDTNQGGWSDPVSYFELNLSAHWATVGSFVPTDVDPAIRFKLWNQKVSDENLGKMTDISLAALKWPIKKLTRRYYEADGEILSGHQGEWFSVIAAAYGSARRRDKVHGTHTAEVICQAIRDELLRQMTFFTKLKSNRDGKGLLFASYLLAHNFGDLTRVLDQWNISQEDPVRVKSVVSPTVLLEVEKLNNDIIAPENHRHLSLRAPKILRISEDFLLPICPFLDDWGKTLSRHPALENKDLVEVIEALVDGWKRLKNPTQAYPRALSGILENCRGGFKELSKFMPSRLERDLSQGALRSLISVPKQRFEDQWIRSGTK